MDRKKYRIGIIGGGYSSEYAVSMNSATEVLSSLDKKRFEPELIEIKPEVWSVILEHGKKLNIDRHDFSYVHSGKKQSFDAIFNAVHGHPGENGLLKAYFDLLGLPATGSSVLCSNLSFTKSMAKKLVQYAGIPVAPAVLLKKGEKPIPEKILGMTGIPCFVKPNKGGSSCGNSKVNQKDELLPALELAFREDDEVLIERFIGGRELACGLLTTKKENLCFPVTEIITKKEFFDYEAKYTPGLADEITPANIALSLANECQDYTQKIAELLGCSGLVRADFIFDGKKLWFLEMNTIPGMTGVSIVPKQIRALGREPGDIYGALLDDILED